MSYGNLTYNLFIFSFSKMVDFVFCFPFERQNKCADLDLQI